MVVGGGDLSRLSRRHGIKVGAGSPYTVEEVALAVGEVVGFDSIKSASRMNSAVVMFLDEVKKVELCCCCCQRHFHSGVSTSESCQKDHDLQRSAVYKKRGSVQSPVPVRTAGVPHKDGSVGMQITETKARRLSQKVSLHAAKRCYFSPEPDSDF